MVENISAKELVVKIIKWRKMFLWISIASAVLTGIIVFLMPKQYKSTVILFPTRQFSISKMVIEANAGNQEDYMRIGDEDDCEKLIQLLTSDALKMKVANAFNLWDRWKLRDSAFAYHNLKLKWDEMIAIKRTEYNSVKIEVYDYTANNAAQLANGISDYCDSVKWDMTKKLAGDILVIVEKEYFATLSRIKVLEDSLNVLRSMGVLHYKEQVKAYSKSYARAIEKNDIPAMKRLEGKLDTLKKYGGAYQYIHDDLDKYSSKYPDIKMKYDEAMVNYTGLMPAKFVVEKAIPNEFKARPKRIMYILISVLACNIMGLFLLLIRDKFRKEIKPEVEKGQHSPQN